VTVTTTALLVSWDTDVPRTVHPPLVAPADAPGDQLDEHARSIEDGEAVQPDPDARIRMANMLHSVTGWDIFPELATDRDYVSRLWAEDWDSPEDAIYDTE
jgi:hypothetical protein